MTEPAPPSGCPAHCDNAPELALGLLTGRERADALAHLDRCPACRGLVEDLTRVHDTLRSLPPAHDPPTGFETRVLARLPRPRRRARTVALAGIAATAALVGAAGVGAVLATPAGTPSASSGPVPALRVAEVTAVGHDVGQVFVYPGPPAWLYMYLDLDRATGPVTCTVFHSDGTRVVAGAVTITGEDAFWGGPLDTADVVRAQVTDATGAVVAEASFPTVGG